MVLGGFMRYNTIRGVRSIGKPNAGEFILTQCSSSFSAQCSRNNPKRCENPDLDIVRRARVTQRECGAGRQEMKEPERGAFGEETSAAVLQSLLVTERGAGRMGGYISTVLSKQT